MASNPRARLTSIFQDSNGQAQGNDALRYVAPKEPTRQQQQQAAPAAAAPAAAPAAAAATATVRWSTTVALYQYDTSARKYVQMGDASSGNMTIGCAIVGSDTSYNLLFYNAVKTYVCAVPIKFATLKMTLQPKCYVNFYDDKSTNWSIKFASDAQVAEFRKQVFLTKIHVEIWGTEKSVTKTNPNALIQEELVHVKDDAAALVQGDTVAVSFSCWRVVGNAACAPSEVVSKYPPFERASESELRKFRLGDGSERIKALEEGTIGMKKGGRRIILAPPAKTNGQEWYLLEVQVVKTKTGGSSSSRSKSVAQPSPSEKASEPAPERRSSRRRSAAPASSANDIVPFDEAASRDEMELRELRLLQKEKQLEIQAKALERAQLGGGQDAAQQQQQQPNPYAQQQPYGAPPPVNYSYGGPMYNAAPPPMVSSTGRPLDGLIMELHAKVDYLIRMAPGASGNSSNSSFGSLAGATDVASVIRGVERLAGENERLLLQINSQNQQYTSYEKRCEELLRQNQRLQEEKRAADDKYQSLASQQMNFSSEIASLSSARDAAITQTNRLHAEYQQLLNAYYQKQQVSSDAEEKMHELNFEREARMRLEKELQKEGKTRSLVEQELQLVKKELDVSKKLRESELQTMKHDLEQQAMSVRAKEQEIDAKVLQVRMEAQQQEAKRVEELRAQLSTREQALQSQFEAVQAQVKQLMDEKAQLLGQVDSAHDQLRTLQASSAASREQLQNKQHDEAEERRIYQEQIEILQQRVQELEQEKFQRVQQDLDSGRLSSPSSSPRHKSGGGDHAFSNEPCANCATLTEKMAQLAEKEAGAERTLALAQELKREAEQMLQSTPSTSGDGERERLVGLFKEAVNEMFFRFQDFFEEESSLDGAQVLTVIRKVLKQNTKDIIAKLNASPTAEEERTEPVAPTIAAPTVVVAATVATVATDAAGEFESEPEGPSASVSEAEGDGDQDDAGDDMPPPPAEHEVAAQVQAEAAGASAEADIQYTLFDAPPDATDDEDDAGAAPTAAAEPTATPPKSGPFSRIPSVKTAAELMQQQMDDHEPTHADSDASDFEP
ncbi:TPA: hypothetical protein N0F65_003947 [Lagenidium giganteum]|uniref:Peptidylprolyl isomerase n=1 Tax=Lagenidium giganteum TaxID=4803 RepID=A0AAV2YW37_9STRA|nr:TPA: hypothetical protein N0F65_003947 [Lagenidium giganteum]